MDKPSKWDLQHAIGTLQSIEDYICEIKGCEECEFWYNTDICMISEIRKVLQQVVNDIGDVYDNKCPMCGKYISIDNSEIYFCPYCGNKVIHHSIIANYLKGDDSN